MRKLTLQEIQRKKPSIKAVKSKKKSPIYFVLDNIRSLYNIGSIFRTADGILCEKIYICGKSGTPPNKKIEKVALGAVETIEYDYFESTLDCLKRLKNDGVNTYCIELTDQSYDYNEIEYKLPCALVLGNEIDGIDDEVVENCDFAVSIAMNGRANSLNVATAAAIVGYKVLAQTNANNK